MWKLHLLTIVFLLVIGVLIVSSEKNKAIISERINVDPTLNATQYYTRACEGYSRRGSGWDPTKIKNYGCKFACRPMRYSRYNLPDRFPCAGNTNNWCLNKKCYRSSCIKKCIKLVGSEKITSIFSGKGRYSNLTYCATNLDWLTPFAPKQSYNATSPEDYMCELPNQETSGLNDTTDGLKEVDPIPTCTTDNKGNLADMRIWNNGCKFTCLPPTDPNRKTYYQPNGLSCGKDMECLYGNCYTSKCVKDCKDALGQNTLYSITLYRKTTGTEMQCGTQSNRNAFSISPVTTPCGSNIIDNAIDGNTMCDGTNATISITYQSAQDQCKALNSGKTVRGEVVNCGCRVVCRSTPDGDSVYNLINTKDMTSCSSTSPGASCLSGQCRRNTDISSCQASLGTPPVRIIKINCTLYCYNKMNEPPTAIVNLTGGECPPESLEVDPIQTCTKVNAGNLQDMRIWNNACTFTCQAPTVTGRTTFFQPNGLNCGSGMECLNGDCLTSVCIKDCQNAIGATNILYSIWLMALTTGSQRICGTQDNPRQALLSMTTTCGVNINNDKDGSTLCDGSNGRIALTYAMAQQQCKEQNPGKTTKGEVVNCGCRLVCRSAPDGNTVYTRVNTADMTICGDSASCLAGECKRNSDIESCKTSLGSAPVRVLRQNCTLYCYKGFNEPPTTSVQLTELECAPAPLDPPTTCSTVSGFNLQDMRIWNNGCKFTCQSPSVSSRTTFFQLNGVQCGNLKECLNGECYTSNIIKECQRELGSNNILYTIKLLASQAGSLAECSTQDESITVSVPVNATLPSPPNNEDDSDRTTLCDGINNAVLLTQQTAQSQCNSNSTTPNKAQVMNCGCRYMCFSPTGDVTYSENNVNDGTACGTDAACVSGECKRNTDNARCLTALSGARVVRILRQDCTVNCYTGLNEPPTVSLQLTDQECTGKNNSTKDPTTTCKGNIQDLQIWNNGCYFTCKSGGTKYNQPNGVDCGVGKVCYNGNCYTPSCIQQCQKNLGTFQLSYIKIVMLRNGVLEARCHVVNRVLTKARFPVNSTFTCGTNIEDDQDGTSRCDSTSVTVAITLQSAQAQCDAKYPRRSPKAEVVNCGCKYNCRSTNGRSIYSQTNLEAGTKCASYSSCLSGECKRDIDIARCQTLLNNDEILTRVTRQLCTLSCYVKGRTAPRLTVQLTSEECAAN